MHGRLTVVANIWDGAFCGIPYLRSLTALLSLFFPLAVGHHMVAILVVASQMTTPVASPATRFPNQLLRRTSTAPREGVRFAGFVLQ